MAAVQPLLVRHLLGKDHASELSRDRVNRFGAQRVASRAHRAFEEVRSAKLLQGLRGAPPADRSALVDLIVRVGRLAAEHPEIAELDLNPVLVLPASLPERSASGREGAVAVDVRVITAP